MRIYSATDVGQKRKMNQDYVFATADPVGNLPNLFVVADGMGGHNAGDYASSHAVTSMVEEIRQDADFNPVKVIRHAIECVNTEILTIERNYFTESLCQCTLNVYWLLIIFINVTYITENDKLFHYNTKGKQDRSSLLSRLQKLCQ